MRRLIGDFAWAAALAVLPAAIWIGLFHYAWDGEHPSEVPAQIVECYSGGHLIFEEMCEDCSMFTGYVGGVNMDGQKFHSNADCIITEAAY